MSAFGTILKQLRIKKEMTQVQLAKVLNVSESNISKYERGKQYPTTTLLIQLADFFEVSLDELLGRTINR